MMKKLISLFHVRVEKDTIGGINDPRHAEIADQYEKEKTIERKKIKDIRVERGRSVTKLDSFRFKSKQDGCHFLVYTI